MYKSKQRTINRGRTEKGVGVVLIFQNVPHVKPVGERRRGNKAERKRDTEHGVLH